jgi:hypothetical protein
MTVSATEDFLENVLLHLYKVPFPPEFSGKALLVRNNKSS